jgi:hypothetical protein
MWAIHALRGGALAAGAATCALLAAALLAPPVLTAGSAALVWLAVAACAAAGFGLALAPALHYRGARIAQLLADRDAALAARMRSALELRAQRATESSAELVAAHLADVELSLSALPVARVVPARHLLHWSLGLGLLAAFAGSWLLARDSRSQVFLSGLRRPAPVLHDGTRVANIAKHVRVRVSYPSYLGRAPQTLDDPREVDVPIGSHLELRVTPAFAALRGSLHAKNAEIALARAEDGALEGRFTARHTDSFRIRIESGGQRYEDPRPIQLRVAPDTKPVVEIEEPRNGAFVTADASIALRFVASDDVGLAAVDMHVRTPSGAERQRRLFSALDDGGPQPTLRAAVELVPAELGAREGDTLVVWLEAQDEDAVRGPNIGKSAEVSLEVTGRGRTLSGFIPELQTIADGAVDVLGDRLENEVPDDPRAARTRFTDLERGARTWLAQLEALLAHADHSQAGAVVDSDQLRGVKRRNQRLLAAEAALHGASVHSRTERGEADARLVDELERDVLLLADMLAKAHVDEARVIAEELRGLKQRIEALLDKLGKSQSPDAERELLAEIAKAERRLAELAQSLSRMATRVPSEFVNRDAVPQEQAQTSLSDLERAVRDHDLQAAADHLDALAKQIDDLAGQLGQGGLRLAENRFGPRDKALAAAQQQLQLLASEQERLAGRSSELARGAQRRAAGDDGADRAQKLAPQAQALEEAVSKLAQEQRGWQSAAMSRAQERLRDAHDALRTGDLARGRDMAEASERGLMEASGELQAEASMFPGHHGETAERARRAERAQKEAERLAEEIARAMPNAAEHMTDAERNKLRGDVEPQRKAREAARQLEDQFSKGPDGLPLSPEAAEALQDVRKQMSEAERALDHGEPDQAAQEQREASERLQKAAQQLAKKQQGAASGGGEREGATGARAEAPVRIPGEGDWKGPTELRRKLLDAMHEASPSGFEAAVQRYYEELLR